MAVHAAAAEQAPRLLPPQDGPDVNTVGVESDGTRRIIAFGLRARAHPDGGIDVARQVFPLARNVQALELPARFGQGLLFWQTSSGRTRIWRAPSFAGELSPYAELDFEVERVAPGFDRLYFQSRRTADWVALDAAKGTGLGRGSLPVSPTLGNMAFADEWFGAVELPIAGVLVSFDAGQTWHSLGRTVQLLGVDAGELLLATPEGRRKLAADGSLRSVDLPSSSLTASEAVSRRIPEGPLGASPLTTAVLHGFEDAGHAIVAARGNLVRLRLSDGRVLDSRDDVMPRTSECSALRVGDGPGFVCSESFGKTWVYAFQKPLSLRLVEQYDSPRRIVSSGNGGFVVSGSCGPSRAEAERTSVVCVRSPAGKRFELSSPKGSIGVERVIALKNGGAAVLTPPLPNRAGTLRLVSAAGVARSVPLGFDGVDAGSRSILKGAFWLDGWIETTDGRLAGWAASRNEFLGVHISPAGVVKSGVVRRGIERALFAGERALLVPAAGVAEQTVDGGASFTKVDLPPGLPLEALKAGRVTQVFEQGCSALGCAFAGWLRVGWDRVANESLLELVDDPEPARFPQARGGRWLLHCAPTGVASAAARAGASDTRRDGEMPWNPYFEQAAPTRGRDELGYQNDVDSELRAYAWGSQGADFARSGRFAASVLDPYRTSAGIWSTLPSPSPWPDAVQVAETFGYEGSGNTAWGVALDPEARSGVLSLLARGSLSLFAVEENRRVARLLDNPARQGVGPVLSAVRIGTSYYVATRDEQRAFRVFQLENGEARMLGQYADLTQGRGVSPVLVRASQGDALGIWTRGPGWFVFPIDGKTGAVASAIEISPEDLSHLPRTCAPDEEGYLLEGPIGIEPYVEYFDGAEHVAGHAYRGRFLVGAGGFCVVALSAQSDSAVDPSMVPRPAARAARAAGASSVALTLVDRAERGKRWGFRCAN